MFMEGFFKPEIIWCLLGIVMLMLEFMCQGFVILFFGIGALVVALICLFVVISINRTDYHIFHCFACCHFFTQKMGTKCIQMAYCRQRQNEEKHRFICR